MNSEFSKDANIVNLKLIVHTHLANQVKELEV